MNRPVIFDLDPEDRLTKDMTHRAVNKSFDGASSSEPEYLLDESGKLAEANTAMAVLAEDFLSLRGTNDNPRRATYSPALGGIIEAAQVNKE